MANSESLASTLLGSGLHIDLNPAAAPSPAKNAPVIVGIYGLPGCGKTYLLNRLKQELGQEDFAFFEGSKVISSLVPGGLDAFRKLAEPDKVLWRQRAIESIRADCIASGKLGIVTGHYMFWTEGEREVQPVCTPQDLDTYTHIIYLDVSVEIIAQRRRDDVERSRSYASIEHLDKWQDTEILQLRDLCRDHNILFRLLSTQATLVDRTVALIRDFRNHTEAYNLSCAESKLDEILDTQRYLQTMLVLDADKTLAAEDTGDLFWATAIQTEYDVGQLKRLFGGPLGYSYTAFRQAVMMYEETVDKNVFDDVCTAVAASIKIHPEFLSFLRLVTREEHVGALIVTCGLRRVWEKILEVHGLSGVVKVIGGGPHYRWVCGDC